MRFLIVTAALLGVASGARAAVEYRLDDGLPELGVGFPQVIPPGFTGPVSMTIVNGFVVQAGGERITAVSVRSPAWPFGGDLTAYVWEGGATTTSANGAMLRSIASITLPAAGPDIQIDVPDTDFSVGDVFFVGMQLTYTVAPGPSVLFGLLDRDGTDNGFSLGLANSSFVTSAFGGPQDHTVLNAVGVQSGVGFAGNWILRAAGDAVPPPGCAAPLLGLALAARRRS